MPAPNNGAIPNYNGVLERARNMFVYFSRIMDIPVLDADGKRVGEIYDIIVKPGQIYPQSSHLIIRRGFPNRQYALVKWTDIKTLGEKEVTLKVKTASVEFRETHDNKEELTLRRDILDQQVVDTHNHKVIRVNDIHLLDVEQSLMIAHVDISMRGLVRRLGFEKPVDFIFRIFNKNAEYLTKEHLITWKHIQPLSVNPASMTIKINVPQKQFNNIPAADLGEIFLDLTAKQQMLLFKSLDLATRTKVFMGVDFKTQRSLIDELTPKEGTDILNSLPTDEATDFLEKLPRDATVKLLALMETKQARKLSELIGYSSDSAGGLMTTEHMVFQKDTSVESVLKQIRERVFKTEPVQFVYIVDSENHLIGATNFRHLMLAQATEAIEKAAFPKTYFVRLDSSVKEIAYLMEKYKYYAIPVVNDDNVLQGIVTVDDILSQVIAIAWRRFKKIQALKKTL